MGERGGGGRVTVGGAKRKRNWPLVTGPFLRKPTVGQHWGPWGPQRPALGHGLLRRGPHGPTLLSTWLLATPGPHDPVHPVLTPSCVLHMLQVLKTGSWFKPSTRLWEGSLSPWPICQGGVGPKIPTAKVCRGEKRGGGTGLPQVRGPLWCSPWPQDTDFVFRTAGPVSSQPRSKPGLGRVSEVVSWGWTQGLEPSKDLVAREDRTPTCLGLRRGSSQLCTPPMAYGPQVTVLPSLGLRGERTRWDPCPFQLEHSGSRALAKVRPGPG